MKSSFFIFLLIVFTSCAYSNKTSNRNNDIAAAKSIISEISTSNQPSLGKKDIAKLFCSNLTEYFNTYKYFNISSEIFNEKEKQGETSTVRITQKENLYEVEYIGASGRYSITFSKSKFPNSDEILTFGRQTILGNAIRSKVYDTFGAWIQKEEISLKSNYNSYLYVQELDAAIEVENWFNKLSSNGSKN